MADDPIRVTLTDEATIAFVRAKVRSGEYASEADVVRDCVALLREDEAELESWLKDVGATRYDAFHADPSSAMTADELEARRAERRARRTALAS
jgi:antitoxin ParD1/3/4